MWGKTLKIFQKRFCNTAAYSTLVACSMLINLLKDQDELGSDDPSIFLI